MLKEKPFMATYLIDYELDGKDCSLLLNEDVVRLCQNSNKGMSNQKVLKELRSLAKKTAL